MRKTITISVSEPLYNTILERTRETWCSSVSEYIRRLVRQDENERGAPEEFPRPRRARDIIDEVKAARDINLSNLR